MQLPPNPPAMPVAAISRFRLLDAYVGMNVGNWQISFGKQSLWWGPGEEGAMLFTNNAEPLNKMFRINRVSPYHLPYVGDIRMEFFIGQVAGQQFINNSATYGSLNPAFIGQYGRPLALQPFFSGGKISFKFTPNFEISMSKTTLYGGPGNPLTFKTMLESTFATHVNGASLGQTAMQGWISPTGSRSCAIGSASTVTQCRTDEISPVNRPYKAAFQSWRLSWQISEDPQA